MPSLLGVMISLDTDMGNIINDLGVKNTLKTDCELVCTMSATTAVMVSLNTDTNALQVVGEIVVMDELGAVTVVTLLTVLLVVMNLNPDTVIMVILPAVLRVMVLSIM